jgi:hypothetical protein
MYQRKENAMYQFPSITCRRSAAIQIFNRFLQSGKLFALGAKLAGKPAHLEDFNDFAPPATNCRCLLGLQDIPVEKITGSVNRSREFTRDFRPLKKHLAQRWAVAYLLSEEGGWPPVKVYKVEDRYFVEDGHHRVSVARFLGMVDIQAEVWEYELKSSRPVACKPICVPVAAGEAEALLA